MFTPNKSLVHGRRPLIYLLPSLIFAVFMVSWLLAVVPAAAESEYIATGQVLSGSKPELLSPVKAPMVSSNLASQMAAPAAGTFNTVWVSAGSEDTYHIAWGDMDGDGDLDLAAANNYQSNRVYRNDGNNNFTDITGGDLALMVAEKSTVIAWGDMDGDGDLDLAVGNENQPNKVYRNDGSGVFSNVTKGDLAVEADYTWGIAWGDLDGDGDLDLAAGNRLGVNKIYRNDGAGVFTNITTGTLPLDTDGTWSIAWGDMDGDGDLDLVAGNRNSANKVYRNDGGISFVDITSGYDGYRFPRFFLHGLGRYG